MLTRLQTKYVQVLTSEGYRISIGQLLQAYLPAGPDRTVARDAGLGMAMLATAAAPNRQK